MPTTTRWSGTPRRRGCHRRRGGWPIPGAHPTGCHRRGGGRTPPCGGRDGAVTADRQTWWRTRVLARVGYAVPSVPPIAGSGSVGLILPTTQWAFSPGQSGSTLGANKGTTNGVTDWLVETCRAAEAAGAGALWAVDHLFWPSPMLECLTTLTVAATATRTATLGTCVLQLPLRRPAAVAKQAAALQLLSGGRFVLGVGAGSHPGEYEMAGVDFGDRGRQMDVGIAEVRAAWASAGEPDVDYRQEPAPAPVPLWVGGSSDAARRRAARAADGWVPL